MTGNVPLIFSLLFALILIILVTGRRHRSVAALLGAFLPTAGAPAGLGPARRQPVRKFFCHERS